MGKLKLLFFLWGIFYPLLGITASEVSLKNWIGEDSSGKFKMTKVDDCLDIVGKLSEIRFLTDIEMERANFIRNSSFLFIVVMNIKDNIYFCSM